MSPRDRADQAPREPRPVAGKPPPHDLIAERAVVSACLLSADALDVAASNMRPEDCYAPAHKILLGIAFELHAAGQAVDSVTMLGMLRTRERLAEIGGPSYLAEVVDATPAVHNVAAHARIVREHARDRETIHTCQRIAASGYFDHGDPQAWREAAATALDELARPQGAERGALISHGLRETFQDLIRSADAGGLLGYPTGLQALDRALGGGCPGDVTVVGGRPGMGKTAFALRWAEAVAEASDRDGTRCGAFVASLEMPRPQLARREAFCRAGVNLSKLKTGGLSVADWKRLEDACSDLARLPLWIDDSPALSPLQLRAKVRRQRADFRRQGVTLRLVVVDYLQLMNGRAGLPRGASREEAVAECSRKLKELAKEMEVHVVALSQLNRAVETRGKDKRPTMADLRESGAIEQDADNILLLYRPSYYDQAGADRDVAEVIVEKQRNGDRGTVRAKFEAWCTRWSDVDGPAEGWQDA
ncbi:MAG TPA: replicative DNA helicase [Anaeromyxobacteraceae bacterium]|nr:replicative DNA helicase [Anaeromyxobacteraceae bacterium]